MKELYLFEFGFSFGLSSVTPFADESNPLILTRNLELRFRLSVKTTEHWYLSGLQKFGAG